MTTGSVITDTIFISTWHCGHSSGSTRLRQGFGGAGLEHLAQQARPTLPSRACELRFRIRQCIRVELRPPAPPTNRLFFGRSKQPARTIGIRSIGVAAGEVLLIKQPHRTKRAARQQAQQLALALEQPAQRLGEGFEPASFRHA